MAPRCDAGRYCEAIYRSPFSSAYLLQEDSEAPVAEAGAISAAVGAGLGAGVGAIGGPVGAALGAGLGAMVGDAAGACSVELHPGQVAASVYAGTDWMAMGLM